jgi:hypothetical protein
MDGIVLKRHAAAADEVLQLLQEQDKEHPFAAAFTHYDILAFYKTAVGAQLWLLFVQPTQHITLTLLDCLIIKIVLGVAVKKILNASELLAPPAAGRLAAPLG